MDLIFFCVGQKEPIDESYIGNIFIEPEQRYCTIWKFISQSSGVWYNLRADKDEIGGTKLCEYIGFDAKLKFPGLPFKKTNCMTVFAIRDEYLDSFKKTVTSLLDSSPIGTVYILARYQSSDTETVLGTYTSDKYLSMMKSNKVYANVCYIITKNPNAIA